MRFAEAVLVAVVFNCSLVLAAGIGACFGLKSRPVGIYFFDNIALLMIIIFAADITAAGALATADSQFLKEFGTISKMGVTMVIILWLAAIHMVAVCGMWLLMGARKMGMNAAVKARFPWERRELRRSSSGFDYLTSI